MERTIYTCDICNREVKKGDIFKVKVRSSRFVVYDDLWADRKTIEVCKDCIEAFRRFVRGGNE